MSFIANFLLPRFLQLLLVLQPLLQQPDGLEIVIAVRQTLVNGEAQILRVLHGHGAVRLLKHLLEHPEELEKPMKEEVIYE